MDIKTQLSIAENLKYLRNLFGYTQAELSDKIHICRSTYAAYETGSKIPGTETILNLSKLYKINVDTILDCNILKILNNLIYIDNSHNRLRELIQIFHDLSPYGKVCLIERADLLLKEEQERKQKYEKELPDVLVLAR